MIIYDLEADGLYEEATQIHCLVAKVNKEVFRFYDTYNIEIEQKESDQDLTKENIFRLFYDNQGPIVCHNQLGYDMHMLKKFFGIDLLSLFGFEGLIDTFVWSQALHPDRELPRGCPTMIINPNGGKGKRIGPHGLDSYGYRIGRKKPAIHDWSTFTNDMLIRCEEDVLINEGTLKLLSKERGDL